MQEEQNLLVQQAKYRGFLRGGQPWGIRGTEKSIKRTLEIYLSDATIDSVIMK